MTKPTMHCERLNAQSATDDGRLVPKRGSRLQNQMPCRSDDFTIVELMITLVLAAIILSAAVPSFRDLVQSNRITAQVNEFVTALNLARSEAIKRGVPVRVCTSVDSANCAPAGGWQQGWIVFSDIDSDGTQDFGTDQCLATEDCLLRVVNGPLAGNATVTAPSHFLVYQASGMVGAALTFTHTIPQCTGDQARTISVSTTGQASVTKTPCT
ncbi:MAG: GspH/FimT family pseudopilin [Gammaproteobacteria bacterium]